MSSRSLTTRDARGHARTRVIVCGTTFGQVYLEAFRRPNAPFELAGILGLGSERTRACASFYGVPLYTDLDELPGDIDVACVVVRGGLLGGRGTELAKRLMARRIHVLQEQPVHHEELADCLREAHRHGVCYRVNPFYRHLPVVRSFIDAARALLRTRKPIYVEAAGCIQVAFPMLDVMHAVLGPVRPWALSCFNPDDKTRSGSVRSPFQRLEGTFAAVPTTLKIQNQVHPVDPDDYAQLLMRVSVSTECGDLNMCTTHGPLVWIARPELPREVRDGDARRLFGQIEPGPGAAGALLLDSGFDRSQRALFRQHWPSAVEAALIDLLASVTDKARALRHSQNQLSLCRAFQDVVDALGPPELLRSEAPPAPLSETELAAIIRAGSTASDDFVGIQEGTR